MKFPHLKIIFLTLILLNQQSILPGNFPSTSAREIQSDAPQTYTSLFWEFIKKTTKDALENFLINTAAEIEKKLTEPLTKKICEELEKGKDAAHEQLTHSFQGARLRLFKIQDHYPRATFTTQQLLLGGATVGLTSWTLQSDILPKQHLFPQWAKSPRGSLAIGGILALPLMWKTLKFFFGKKQFILTQDEEISKSFTQLLNTQIPLFIEDLQETLGNKEKFSQFKFETNNAIALYGTSTVEEKKDFVRTLAHTHSIPVFFISCEDLQKSPEKLSDTFDSILNQAQKAQEAHSTLCSFICFTDFDQLKELPDFPTLFEKVDKKLFEITQQFFYGRARTPQPLPFVIFGMSQEEQEHEEGLFKDIFSFKINISHKEDDPTQPLQLTAFNPPSFSKGIKKRLSTFETPKLTLEEIPNDYPEEIKMLVWEIENERTCEESNSFLFYGPPGTGKTMLARALAGTLQVPFFNISMLDVLKKQTAGKDYFDEIFTAARNEAIKRKKPSIIFLDECDILLKNLEDIEGENKQLAAISLRKHLNDLDHHIIFIAATNRTTFDRALTRSKRLGTRIYFDLPQQPARQQIIAYYLKKRIREGLIDEETSESLAAEYAPKTESFSPADIEELIIKAARRAHFSHTILATTIEPVFALMLEEKIRQEKSESEIPVGAGVMDALD